MIEHEERIPLKSASRLFAGKPTYQTLLRWVNVGIKVQGVPVRLEHIKEGWYLYTSREAVTRFIRRQNPHLDCGQSPTPPASSPGHE